MYKRGASGEAYRPAFSVVNPALTQTLPAYQTACGVTDIMAHLFERYFTTSKEVETTDRMIEGLLLAMIHEAPRVIFTFKNSAETLRISIYIKVNISSYNDKRKYLKFDLR